MYNNPYNMYPYMTMPARGAIRGGFNMGMGANMVNNAAKPGFFRSLAGIKWGNILSNTQKTLNVINQAIPVYYQIKPIYNNLRSFGKIMSAFNETQEGNNNQNNLNNRSMNNQDNIEVEKKENSNQPTFFIN